MLERWIKEHGAERKCFYFEVKFYSLSKATNCLNYLIGEAKLAI